jgi:hypothetical protein
VTCDHAPVPANDAAEENALPSKGGVSPALSRNERASAASVGVVAVGAGVVATFASENELGTLALLIVGGSFLLIAVTRALPTRLNVAGNSVVLERTYEVIQRAITAGGVQVQDELQDALDVEVAVRGVELGDAAVEAVLQKFANYSSSSEPIEVAAAMRRMDWQPTLPPRRNYIRWVYDGRERSVSLYQNSGSLVAGSTALHELVRQLPGAVARGNRNDVVFGYLGSVEAALVAADVVRRFADGG